MKKRGLLADRTRGGVICLVDPDTLPEADGSSPIVLIAEAIINARYTGLKIDLYELADGRYYEVLSVDFDTLEGQLLRLLDVLDRSKWPTPEQAVHIIRTAYDIDEENQQ